VRRRSTIILGVLSTLVVVAQFAGPARTNPATDASLRLETQAQVPAEVAATLRRACYDCHSNETRWPLYAKVAPMAWLVVYDVNRGRGQMNFSRWGEYNPFDRADMLDEACEEVRKGEMPLGPYLLLHGDARLSPQDVEALCAWAASEAGRLTGASPEQ
jgi:hypothetical protein